MPDVRRSGDGLERVGRSNSPLRFLARLQSGMPSHRSRAPSLPSDMPKPKKRPPDTYAAATAMLSSATALFLGFDLAMVSSTAVFVEADLKLLASIVVVSAMLGAVTTVAAQGLVGDRCMVLLSAAVLCSGALVRGLATNFAAFVAGICINGVGMGQALMIVPAYAAELTPSSSGGLLASHPDGFLYLGCIVGSLCYSTAGFARLPVHLAWRLTIASGTAVPTALAVAVLLMPESPRWLVAKDQLTKARRVLSKTSPTLEDAELRMLDIKAELRIPHDGCEEPAPVPAHHRWREECSVWRELLVRPTDPFRRALVSALVAKVFQHASGIGSMLQYVQAAFRKVGVSSGSQTPIASVAFGFVIVLSFAVSLLVVEISWLLVSALSSSCWRRPSNSLPCRGGSGCTGMTRRQHQLKWARGLSATMLFSLTALVWIALGPVQWADTAPLRATASVVNGAVSAAILSSFAWLFVAIALYGNLLVCVAVVVLGWWFFVVRLRDANEWCVELTGTLFPKKWGNER